MAKLNISGDAISRSSLRKVIREAWDAVEASVNALYDLVTDLTVRVTQLEVMKRYVAGLYSLVLNVAAPIIEGFTVDGAEGDNPTTLQVVITSTSTAGETLPSDMEEAIITDDTTECTLTWNPGLGAEGYRVYFKYDDAETYEGYIEITDPETLTLDMFGTLTPDVVAQPPAVGDAGTFHDFNVNTYYTTIGTIPTLTAPSAGVLELAHAYFDTNTVIHTPVVQFTNSSDEVIRITTTKEEGKLVITTTVDGVETNGVISNDNFTLNVEMAAPAE